MQETAEHGSDLPARRVEIALCGHEIHPNLLAVGHACRMACDLNSVPKQAAWTEVMMLLRCRKQMHPGGVTDECWTNQLVELRWGEWAALHELLNKRVLCGEQLLRACGDHSGTVFRPAGYWIGLLARQEGGTGVEVFSNPLLDHGHRRTVVRCRIGSKEAVGEGVDNAA